MTDPCTGVPQSEYCRLKGEACGHRFQDLRALFLANAEDQGHALDLAKAELDRRLEGMNEFRAQLERQAKEFVDIKTYQVQHKNLENKIADVMAKVDGLTNWKFEQAGRSDRNQLYAVASLVIAVLAAASHFWR